MKHYLVYIILFLVSLILPSLTYAQKDKAKENWHHLDFTEDSFYGISTEKAYQLLLKNKKNVPIIVAVIDNGVEINHEDLKTKLWVNKNEQADNKLDDDGNGYIDDIHGWNFIGNKDGRNIQYENFEVLRLLRNLQPKFESVLSSNALSEQDKKEYSYYQKLLSDFVGMLKTAQENQHEIHSIKSNLDSILLKMGKENPTLDDFKAYKPTRKEWNAHTIAHITLLEGMDFQEFYENLNTSIDQVDTQLKYHLNFAFKPRVLVGDTNSESQDSHYGNSDVTGPDAFHGTHVAGIIGANRTNDIGVKGIANNVQIMAIRAVPNGDERDKDIANAIRYAVDNGAKVINMSFGKGYSENEQEVNAAAQYAMDHDVLLVQGAGNDGVDIDVKQQFPSRYFLDSLGIKRGNSAAWIVVGASSWHTKVPIANFSNYGKEGVDVFAPGVAINSCGLNSEYKESSGTSMAAPVVAGIAALIRSYYPDFSAVEVKNIIMESVVKIYDAVKVGKDSKTVLMQEICQSGGIVNAYEAIKLADQKYGKKKKYKKVPKQWRIKNSK